MDKSTLDKLMEKFPCKELATGNIRTCPARLSYPFLFEKSPDDGEYKGKYGATLLFPESANISLLKEAVRHTAIEGFGPKAAQMGLRMPFRNKAEKRGKLGYEDDGVFFRAGSDVRPGIRGPNGETLLDKTAIYPGCWVIATVRPFYYSKKGNGVSLGLQNIAKIYDDESFGGVAANPDEEFGELKGAADANAMFNKGSAADIPF